MHNLLCNSDVTDHPDDKDPTVKARDYFECSLMLPQFSGVARIFSLGASIQIFRQWPQIRDNYSDACSPVFHQETADGRQGLCANSWQISYVKKAKIRKWEIM